jgi:serine phosphatase RsbU (regulator of sigma subunit)
MRAELQAARGIITEHQRVQRDLAMAHQIQRQMLPDVFPDIPGLTLAATTLPARGIGGDFYEVVQLERHRVALLLGDVAGTGIHAALEMARLMWDFHACVRACAEPQSVIQTLNRWWCQRHTRVSALVTMQMRCWIWPRTACRSSALGTLLSCGAGRLGTWSPWRPPRTFR